jgi:hypothetical protein
MKRATLVTLFGAAAALLLPAPALWCRGPVPGGRPVLGIGARLAGRSGRGQGEIPVGEARTQATVVVANGDCPPDVGSATRLARGEASGLAQGARRPASA